MADRWRLLFTVVSMAKPAQNPTPLEARSRIQQLRKQIEEHNRLYYEEATSAVSDQEFDALLRELSDLETAFPDLTVENSPTRKVGGKALEGFQQVAHLAPMLSLDNTYSETEAVEFYQRMQKLLPGENIPVVIEPKVDGVAITLIYREGKLDYAATRGDGRMGDDVTRNILTIDSIPQTLVGNAPALIEIRGEVYLPREVFLALNAEQEKLGKPLFANPRNTAAGSLKQLDPELSRKRRLSVLLYGTGAVDGLDLNSHTDALQRIAAWGLPVSDWKRVAESAESMLEAIRELDTRRKTFPYDTDGAVIKVDFFDQRTRLGFTSKAPRWAMAFKYAAEKAETKLLDIQVQVGRTGVLTPVAHLEPIVVSGSRVARATLHNEEEIQRKDIRIGDTVIIEKAGEVIPAIVEVVLSKRPPAAQSYDLAASIGYKCPSCGGPIAREEGFVAWRCFSFDCPAQTATRLKHFAARKMLDIEGVGEIVADKLVERGLVRNPLDLFKLDLETLGTLNLGTAEDPRVFGPKNGAKLLAALDRARTMPLSRWIFAIGVPEVGESAGRELARLHQNFSELAQSPLLAELRQLPKGKRKEDNPILGPYQIAQEVGQVAAGEILDFFASEGGKAMLQHLAELGINPQSDNYNPQPPQVTTADHPIIGKTFVLTGALSQAREVFEEMIRNAGGKTSGSISKKTHYLVAGEESGSKLTKAESLGVKILDEAGLLALLKSEMPAASPHEAELFPL